MCIVFRKDFHAVSALTFEECLRRIEAEDGRLLHVVSAASQMRAATAVRYLDPNAAAFRIEQAFYRSSTIRGEKKYRGNQGLFLEGRLNRSQDNRTEIHGTMVTTPVWFFEQYCSSVIYSLVPAGIAGMTLFSYSIPLAVSVSAVIFAGVMILLSRHIHAHRMRLQRTLTSLLHASPGGQ
ncbi:MAG: hypothetical protein JXB30_12950 [Anaerolineae bacterium]|nr:hypothetical protein [Anaerolineae bacterium]